MTAKRCDALSVAALAVLAAAVFAASAYVVWLGDDVDYGFFISTSIWNSWGPVSDLSHFVRSQANHYWWVNGRALAHATVQFFCGIAGQTVFAVCNALVYCAFVWLLLRLGGLHRPLRHPRAVAAAAALVMLTFVTKMMPTTQIGFVWMFTLNMAWLMAMLRRGEYGPVQGAGLCVLSLLAGNGQEALTLGLSAAFGLWWLQGLVRKTNRFKGWKMAMLVCYWAGTLAICFSPGTLSRAGAVHIELTDSLLYMALSFRAFYALMAVVLWKVCVRHAGAGAIYRRNMLWFNAIAVLMVFNVLVGVYSNRQLFGIELLSLIVLFRELRGHEPGRWWTCAFCGMAAVLFAAQMAGAREVRREYDEIKKLYVASDDGLIYYDRTIASRNALMREYRWYEEIIGQFNNDTHHSLQKGMRKFHQHGKSLKVFPRFMKQRKVVKDTVIEYAPAHFFVILCDSDCHADSVPRAIEVSSVRAWTLGGTDAASADTVEITRATVKGKRYNGAIILPSAPFATPVKVEVVKKQRGKSL